MKCQNLFSEKKIIIIYNQIFNYLEGGPLVWMLPLYLHINQKSDYDDDDMMMMYRSNIHISGPLPDSWLAARMVDLSPDLQVCLSCNPSLSAASMSSWVSKGHAFHQSVCQRLS